MGKGDKRTKRGKLYRGTHGKTRPAGKGRPAGSGTARKATTVK
ncbi:MAG: 30S ribosomal protein THX [Phycisphaerales bacterium]|nr:30S ribosomal protein THX [Phycisphaerales bacterium]